MLKSLLKKCSVGLGLLAAACHGATGSIEVAPRSQAIDTSLSYVVNAGPMWLEVMGLPFTTDSDSFLAIIAGALEDSARHNPPLRLTMDKKKAAHADYRTVILFNPAINLNSYELCSGKVRNSPASGGELTVMAAFCHRENVLAAIQGWGRSPKDSVDPIFRQLIFQMGHSLYEPPADLPWNKYQGPD
jgi:hypothetical protein